MYWYVIFGTIVLLGPVVFFMKKHLTRSELYSTIIFGLLVQTIVDLYASFEFKAWGFFKVEKTEFKSLWVILVLYPIFSSLIINWFPYTKSWWLKVLYLIGWSLFSTGYEWLTMKVDIIWHINWNLLESFILYPFIYYLLILHVRFYRKWISSRS